MAAYTTIDNPELYFQVKLYTGNGGTQSITFDGSEDMQPDFLWVKGRSVAEGHYIQDSVRGVTKHLHTQNTDAEATDTGVVTALNSDGFSLGDEGDVNSDGGTFVAWAWKESATAGFDIISYAGDAAAGRNISHSLGAKPHWMVVKNLTNSIKWAVYHEKNTSAPGTDHLQLNSDGATSDDDSTWDDTEPGSSVFRVKSSTSVNGSSANYIAYLWTPIQGFSKFGAYTANGNADGTFVYTGFRPAFVLTKLTSNSGGSWEIVDSKRDGYNGENNRLYPNNSDAEGSGNDYDLLSNGFKVRQSGGSQQSGRTNIYMAFAEAPFVNSNGVPCNAR
jgi:hypothetical protein